MFRNFSEDAKTKLLGYVEDVTETSLWGKIGDTIGDAGNNVLDWLGWLNIRRYVDDLDRYHKKVIDKNNTTAKQIETIFSNVDKIDERYSEGLGGELGIANAIKKLITDLADAINPNGGNLNVNKFSSVLAADVEKLQESKTSKQSIAENRMLGTDPEGASTSVDPVNLSTGNFIYEHRDLTNAGEIELHFHRYYNSKDSKILSLGKGFRHSYDITLIMKDEKKVEILLADGQHRYFEKDGTYYYATGVAESLDVIDNNFVYINEEQSKHYFDENGKLLRIENRNARGISFEYDEFNKLINVFTDNGNYFRYSYNSNGYISSVVDAIGREIRFEYVDDFLAKVSLPEQTEINYVYSKNGRIQDVINSNKQIAVSNTYDNGFRVTKQRFLDGSEMSFDYDDAKKTVSQIERNGSKTIYVHDEQYRNIETIYYDGSTEKFLYNDRNQCITKTDRNGNVTRISYDNKGNVTQIVDPKKKKSNFTYDAQNHLLSVSVNGKIRVKNTYDKNGNLVFSEDALGNKAVIKYNDNGQKIYEKNANGEFAYEYDGKGNVIEIYHNNIMINKYDHDEVNRVIRESDANGNVTLFDYDGLDRIVKITNSEGKVKEFIYSLTSDKPIKVVDFDQRVASYEYDELGRISSYTDKEGNTTKYSYDVMWNVASVIEPNGGITKYEYNLDNRLSKVIFPNSGETVYEYDYAGNRIMIKDPDGNETRFTYNVDNSMNSVKEPNGAETFFEYDIDGNLILIRDALNNTVSMEYDIMGNRTKYTDEEGNSTIAEYEDYGRIKQIIYPTNGISKFAYDEFGNITSFIDETGSEEHYVYNAYGNMIKKIVNGNCTGFEYDNNNRIIKTINPFGGERKFEYDIWGNIVCIVDENGALTEYTYDTNGLLKSAKEGKLKTQYEYDSVGNIIHIQKMGEDGRIQDTHFEWDLLGNLTKTVSPLGYAEEYIYSKAGRLIEKIDAEGLNTLYRYNSVGDIDEIVYGDKRKAKFSYNLLKQLVCIDDWNGRTTLELNKLGMPRSIEDYNGNIVQYEWGKRNEKTKVVYPDGTKCIYKYNAANQLIEMKVGDKSTCYSYDEFGRFISRTNDDGIKTQYSYNSLGRIEKIINSSSDEIIEEYTYHFDLFGNKIKTIFAGNNQEEILEYGYDDCGRLCSVHKNNSEMRTYQYDAFGNRIKKNDISKNIVTEYFYNQDNQLLKEICADGLIEYQYDKRGNLSIINKPDEKILYKFDATNHVEQITKEFEKGSDTKKYKYSVLGHRIGEEYQSNENLLQTSYVLDYTRRCHNILGKNINKSGIYVDNINYYYDGKIVAMSNGDEQLSYIMSDDHGSCTALVKGQQMHRRQYEEFGEMLGDDSGIFDFGYTGYLYDAYAGEYYAHARMYNQRIGRFSGKDKCRGVIMIPQTLNRYTYCCNRPEDYEDDDGEWLSIAIGAAVGGLVSAAVSIGSQVIDNVKSGDSVGESFKSINYKKVAIEAGKGAIKGAIAGTGLGALSGVVGVATTAATGALVDMAGEVAKQTIVDGKSLKEVDTLKVAETGAFSFAFSCVIGGASKAIQGKITSKFGIGTKMSDLKGREAAVNTVKEQLSRATAKSRVDKLTTRLADKTKEYCKTAVKYTLNKAFGGAYGMIQGAVYKNKLKDWVIGEMDEFYRCTLAA